MRRKAFFGALLAPVPGDIREKEKLIEGEGLVIQKVLPGSTAGGAGFLAADILLIMDGEAVPGSVPGFASAVARIPAGKTVEITFIRNGRRLSRSVLFIERPRDKGGNFDVSYRQVTSNGALIRTIITIPHAQGKHPALFFIQGLGAASIDQPLAAEGSYSRILRFFAENGYVTVRVEKPGIGDSEGGPYEDIDFEAELDSYRKALEQLKSFDFVEQENVFIFGHSMGGCFAPVLAGEIAVNGVIVYGTVARWLEYFPVNTMRQAELSGMPAEQIKKRVHDQQAVLHALLVEKKSFNEIINTKPEMKEALSELMPDGKHLFGRSREFWIQLAAEDIPLYWRKARCNVLSLWGRNDFVSSESDHKVIETTVSAEGICRGRYIGVEGIDHYFKKTASMKDSFTQRSSPGEFNSVIITILKEWLDENIKKGSAPGGDFYFRKGRTETTVPFTLFDNRIMVSAGINGKKPLTFIFDTGGSNIITPEAAESLGLATEQGDKVTGAGEKSVQSSTAKIAECTLGDLVLTNQTFKVVDLSEIRRRFNFKSLDGVLGYEVLQRAVATLDFERGRLILSLPEAFKAPRGYSAKIPFELIGGDPVISGQVSGMSGKILIDTGDRSAFTLFQKFADAHGLTGLFSGPVLTTGYGIGGPISAKLGKIDIILSGEGTIELRRVLSRLPVMKGGSFATMDIAGSIGNEVLRRFNIVFNYGGKEVILTKNRFFDDPYKFTPPPNKR
ncbi:MAG: aspartyl protease family protein [Candidatus Eremiobacteraeota bacterium]|nr:aspartyl protease family protein [Candidatus Eremiobacteraeota bacterium]